MNPWNLHAKIKNLTPLPPISDPRVNGGAPVPLYRMDGPLNTLEGWNAAAMVQNAKAFRSLVGCEPESAAELDAWARDFAAQVVAEAEAGKMVPA